MTDTMLDLLKLNFFLSGHMGIHYMGENRIILHFMQNESWAGGRRSHTNEGDSIWQGQLVRKSHGWVLSVWRCAATWWALTGHPASLSLP